MMAQITVETIETLNIAQVLSSLKKEQDAERALEAQSKALGVTKQQLVKVINAQAKATEIEAKAAERAAKGPSAWTLALRENSAALDDTKRALNDTKSQINQAAEATGKLASAASLLDPRLGAVVQTLQKLEGVASASVTAEQLLGGAWVEGATAAGALTLAVSPLVLALYDLERASTAAAEAQKILEDAQNEELPLIESALDAYTELTIKTSGLTEAEQARAEVARAWDRKLAETNAKTKERLELAQAELDQMAKTDAAYVAQIDLVAGLKKQIAENNETAAQGLAAALATLEYTQEQAAADKKVTEAKKEKTAATKDLYAVERELDKTEQMARERKAKEDREAVEAEMRRKQEAHDQALALFKDEYEYQKQLRELREAADKRAAAERAKQLEAEYESYADLAGGVSDLFGALVDSNIDAAKKGNEAAQDAILKQFHAQQAAAAVEAAINTILAVSKASTVAPPPFNAIAMSAALATGVAQEVAIASQQPPSFDDGAQMPQGTGQRQVVDTAADDYRVYAKTTAGLMEQMVGLMTQQQGAPRRMGRRPIAGDVLSLNASGLIANQLPRTVRGNAR